MKLYLLIIFATIMLYGCGTDATGPDPEQNPETFLITYYATTLHSGQQFESTIRYLNEDTVLIEVDTLIYCSTGWTYEFDVISGDSLFISISTSWPDMTYVRIDVDGELVVSDYSETTYASASYKMP